MLSSRHLFALGVALVLGLAACGDDAQPDSGPRDPAAAASQRLEAEASAGPTSTEVTTSTVGEVDPTSIQGAVINQYSLELGECFNRIDELRDGIATTITSRVDCDLPHTYQVFHRLTYPAPHPSIYPGDGVMRDFAIQSCYREFEPWVGVPYETSALDIEVLTPTQENFEDSAARYRGIHCWLVRADGEPLIGDAHGSQW